MANTAWTNKTNNNVGRVTMLFDLALAGAAQGYTPVIDAIKVRTKSTTPGENGSNGQNVGFWFLASAVTGTNLDIALYGAKTIGGTKYLLVDTVVTDITDTTPAIGILDMQAYPAPYYYISVTGDNAETGNTLRIDVTGDLGGNQVSALLVS